MNEYQNHPLQGVGLDTLLGELVRHYHWEILAEQININCFKSYPNFESSIKFLRKTEWAREKLEAFYLYKFKQCPLPDEEQHRLPPRDRLISVDWSDHTPAEIQLGDPEFFDDPITGPVFPSKKAVQDSRSGSRRSDIADSSKSALDPWAKARQKYDKN